MKTKLKILALLAITMFASAAGLTAEPRFYVPEQLRPWVQWVEERTADAQCARLMEGSACEWPGVLRLELGAAGGSFELRARLDARGELTLPGGPGAWPVEVKSKSGGYLPVLARDGLPAAPLEAGSHELTGRFEWSVPPKSLRVSPEVGLVDLKIDGQPIRDPRRGASGEIWLDARNGAAEAERESLDLEVFRRLSDGLPFRIETQLRFRIAGKGRQMRVGTVLLEGQQPLRVASDLAYHLTDSNELVVQARPGSYVVTIESSATRPPAKLTPAANDAPHWPKQEIWAWQPAEELRSVEIEGPSSIDPNRTELPEAWRSLAAFVMERGAQMSFKEIRRGQTEAPPNALSLRRRLWLDLDGLGFTVQDTFGGSMNQGWRLNSLTETALGHVNVNGQDQLITKDPGSGLSGVELRESAVNLSAESRLEDARKEISAVGWDQDVSSLVLELSLPPGWVLLDGRGADSMTGSWFSSWNLLDFFVVIMVAVAVCKLLGVAAGAVALLGLFLSKSQPGAPFQIWFHLLIALALLRVLPKGIFRTFANVYLGGTAVALILMLIPFSLFQFRSGIFPQLGQSFSHGSIFGELMYLLVETQPGLWIGSMAFLTALFLSVRGRWKLAFLWLIGSGAFVFAALVMSGLSGGGMTYARREMLGSQIYLPPSSAPQSYGSGYGSDRLEKTKSIPKQQQLRNLTQVDPNATVQTGPGLPNWRWGTWTLSWNGMVRKDQKVELFLIGPFANMILSVLRALSMALLALFFARKTRQIWAAGVLMIACSLRYPAPLCAQEHARTLPDAQILSELEGRLAGERCASQCTSTSVERLELEEYNLTVTAEVGSEGPGAWQVPGPLDQFAPTRVTIDNQETSALRRDERGYLWVRVPAGVHELQAAGRLPKAGSVSLGWAEPPHRLETDAPGWQIDGLGENGRVESSIQLTRLLDSASRGTPEGQDEAESKETALPEWLLVTRLLQIGLPWSVETRVTRLGTAERPYVARVAALPGESVTSEAVTVRDGHVHFSFPRGAREVVWASSLEITPSIALTATAAERVNEIWQLACSPIWRCSTQGTNPTSVLSEGLSEISWHPWPGESVSIEVARPEGIPGGALTIDSADLAWTPGARLISGLLTLSLRASRGGYQKLVLPEGSVVKSVMQDSQRSHIRPRGSELFLPLEPGAQVYQISWQMPWENRLFQRVPEVKLDGTAFNARVSIDLAPSRWLLLTGGPDWGPVVLFWSELLVIVAAAVLLALATDGPLKGWELVLLGLGLGNLYPDLMVIPILWLYALKLRRDRPAEGRWIFNFGQLALVGLTFLSLLTFFAAIRSGLIVSPDMNVSGNGSYGNHLVWYTDTISGVLPVPWVISCPIWVWRGFMLIWSAWLVFAVLRWLTWGWGCISSGGLWRARQPGEAKSA